VCLAQTTPRSAWSQVYGQYNIGHTGTEPSHSPRHRSDSSSQRLTTPSTSSSQDEFLTLPPINASYSHTYRDTGRPASNPYLISSSQRLPSSHSRSRSSSEALSVSSPSSDASLDLLAKRRHTIGSPRGSHLRHHTSYTMEPSAPISNLSRNTTPTGHPFSVSRPHVTNPYPAGSTHSSLSRGMPAAAVRGYPPSSSAPPSPPSTSGEEVQTERRKTPAKYECQYCQKRFNRPSSLKVWLEVLIHHSVF
jgi:hypothetical protein